jgi:hypothetical protein
MTFGNDDVIGGGEGSVEVTALSGEAAGERASVDTQPNVDTQSVADPQLDSEAQFKTEELPIVVAQSNGHVQSGADEQLGAAAAVGAAARPDTDSQASDDERPNADTHSAVGAQSDSTAQFDTEQLPIVVAQPNGYAQSDAGEQPGAAISASDDVQPNPTPEQAGAPGTEYAAAVRHSWGSGLWKRRKPLPLGRPRVSTLVLMSVWIAVLALYLVVRPA